MTVRPSARRRTIDARLGLSRGDDPAGRARAITLPAPVGILISIMAGMFILSILLPYGLSERLAFGLGFIPARFAAGLAGQAGPGATIIPLFGHMFLHGNLGHLLFNVLWLAVFGTGVGRRMMIESPRSGGYNTSLFLAFFAASGVAGALFYALFNPASPILLIGASGAISGLMAGAMRFALRPFAPYGPAYGRLASPGARPVLVASAVYIGINLMTAIGAGGLFGDGLAIAWEAHIGGYLFGLFAFPLFDRLARRDSPAEGYVL